MNKFIIISIIICLIIISSIFILIYMKGKGNFKYNKPQTAYIINGKKDGTIETKRWGNAYKLCKKFGNFNCQRIKAKYVEHSDYKDECGDFTGNNKTSKYRRGCMYAHKKIMEKIVKKGEPTFVFEDDISIGNISLEETIRRMNDFISKSKNKNSHIAYIGRCWEDYCTHAYYITVEGAEIVLKNIKWCTDIPIDNQLRGLCLSNKLKCDYAEDVNNKDNTWAQGIIKQSGKEHESPYY